MALIADFDIYNSSRSGDGSNIVNFADSSTGTVTTYKWIFGDGDVAEGAYPTILHNYIHPGKYTVTLVVQNATEQSSITKEDFIIVNEIRPVPFFIIMQSFDNVTSYWRLYIDQSFYLVFETPQFVYRSADKILDVRQWAFVQFNIASEKMYVGSYTTPLREISYNKTVNSSPISMTEAKTEIADRSALKIDELKIWATEKNLADYYRSTRGRAGYLDMK